MSNDERELTLTRLIDAPRENVWRCFTDPELLKRWFVPRPWTISEARVDVRPGGTSYTVMRDPDGNEYPNSGVYLEVVPKERLVVTDAYSEAWKPSDKPFFTAIMTFADEGGKTRYTAIARHWTKEDTEAHVKMGFHEGWGKAADQLEEVARSL